MESTVPLPGCQSRSGSVVAPSLPITSLFRLLPGGFSPLSCSGDVATQLDSSGAEGGRGEGTCRHRLPHPGGCEPLGCFPPQPAHAARRPRSALAGVSAARTVARHCARDVAGDTPPALNTPPEVTWCRFCSRSLGCVRSRGDREVQPHKKSLNVGKRPRWLSQGHGERWGRGSEREGRALCDHERENRFRSEIS